MDTSAAFVPRMGKKTGTNLKHPRPPLSPPISAYYFQYFERIRRFCLWGPTLVQIHPRTLFGHVNSSSCSTPFGHVNSSSWSTLLDMYFILVIYSFRHVFHPCHLLFWTCKFILMFYSFRTCKFILMFYSFRTCISSLSSTLFGDVNSSSCSTPFGHVNSSSCSTPFGHVNSSSCSTPFEHVFHPCHLLFLEM